MPQDIYRYGSHQSAAPYWEIAKSKLWSANGASSASACTSGKRRPNSAWNLRAVASWFEELSKPITRAPRRVNHAER